MQRNEYQIGTISGEEKYLSTLNLIMAMFRLTAQDLKYGNGEIKREAKKFLRSSWFRNLCNGMNLDVVHVRNVIVRSGRVRTRGTYE